MVITRQRRKVLELLDPDSEIRKNGRHDSNMLSAQSVSYHLYPLPDARPAKYRYEQARSLLNRMAKAGLIEVHKRYKVRGHIAPALREANYYCLPGLSEKTERIDTDTEIAEDDWITAEYEVLGIDEPECTRKAVPASTIKAVDTGLRRQLIAVLGGLAALGPQDVFQVSDALALAAKERQSHSAVRNALNRMSAVGLIRKERCVEDRGKGNIRAVYRYSLNKKE